VYILAWGYIFVTAVKIMLKKIPTRRLVFSFLVGPPGLEPGTKGFRFV